MKIRMVMLICAALVIGVAGVAGAYTIDYTQLTPGQNSVAGPGWTAAAMPANSVFDVKGGQGGWQGVGVSGATGGEIDINESITFTFATPQRIDNFILTLLFAAGPYGDPNEMARIIANPGDFSYTLQATGPQTANFLGLGSWTFLGLSATTEGDSAAWRVNNPFGDNLITSMTFTAISMRGDAGGNDSDYAFNSLQTTPVPEPTTMLLLGLGLTGIAGLRRKFSRA